MSTNSGGFTFKAVGITHTALRYVLAVAIVGAACVLQWALSGVLSATPYLIFYPAVVLAAAVAGLGPGLLAILASYLCVDLILDSTPWHLEPSNPVTLARATVFFAGGIGISIVAHTCRMAATRARESEQRFHAFMDNNPAIAWARDENGRYVYMNRTYQHHLRVHPKDWRGKTDLDLWPPDFAKACRQSDVDVLRSGQVGELAGQTEDKEGQRACWRGFTFLFQDTSGRRYVGGVGVDITKQNQAEQDLRRSLVQTQARAAELAALMEAVPAIAFIAHDPQCRHVSANRVTRELLHVPPGANVSRSAPEEERIASFRIVKDGKELSPEESPLHVVAATGHEIHDLKVTLAVEDGPSRDILGNAVPLFDEAGEIRGAVGAFVDITARRQAEQQLKDLNANLEQRVAERTAAAEQRTAQLQTVTMELTLAENRERQRIATILHDHLQQLLTAAEYRVSTVRRQTVEPHLLQALDRISETLDASVQTSRSLTAELFPPALREGTFAESLQWLIAWMHEKHGLQVHARFGENADPQTEKIRLLLFEAVRELLFNTVKHAGVREACLEMVRHSGTQVRIMIADSGRGFDPASLHPKQRLEGGFGLFTIRERLGLLNGSIAIESAPRSRNPGHPAGPPHVAADRCE